MRWRSRPSPREAAALQRELATRVVRTGAPRVRTIAGADASVRSERVYAALCTFSFPELEPLESVCVERPLEFPYVPGLLGFREVPALREAYARLSAPPDLILVDGHGLAHPRRFGVATHLGVELDCPTVGCAKSLLVGEHRPPGPRRGARTRLVHEGELVGVCLRTRDAVQPVYVSIGHRCGLERAIALVLACARRFRLPEPIRAADGLAGRSSGSR